jgi:hypothetical protein
MKLGTKGTSHKNRRDVLRHGNIDSLPPHQFPDRKRGRELTRDRDLRPEEQGLGSRRGESFPSTSEPLPGNEDPV